MREKDFYLKEDIVWAFETFIGQLKSSEAIHPQTIRIVERLKSQIVDIVPTHEVGSPWHTGTPTETGEYLVCRIPEAGYLFRYNQLCVFSDLMGILDHKIFYIGEVGKNSFENITDSVIAWQKIEPYRG